MVLNRRGPILLKIDTQTAAAAVIKTRSDCSGYQRHLAEGASHCRWSVWEHHRLARTQMRRTIKYLLLAALILLVLMPVAFAVTFLLYPFWSWIEASYGIESVGHSGPADWCFWLVYGLLVFAGRRRGR